MPIKKQVRSIGISASSHVAGYLTREQIISYGFNPDRMTKKAMLKLLLAAAELEIITTFDHHVEVDQEEIVVPRVINVK